ncbi:hypothetical protein BVRB_6g145680 [Beta vulgaris subsp. vulgaris]|nr:hypothetical protein BVRB_6g145680 [Beta vulgaris subsp. vulgaris]
MFKIPLYLKSYPAKIYSSSQDYKATSSSVLLDCEQT